MAVAMKGLRLKPTYEQLVGAAVSDGLEHIKFPNRSAQFLRNGFVLSQLGGEGMRAMELQQQRHIKEVYMDSALKPLASDPGSDSISNCSFKSAHTQNTQTERINEMITEVLKLKNAKAEYYDLSGNEIEPPLDLDEDSSSSSDGQNDRRNHIHIEDYLSPIRNIESELMLREMEAERRLHEISENSKMIFKVEPHKIQGGSEMQNMRQQHVINDVLTQIPTPYSIFGGKKPKPLFPSSDPVLDQHLRSVEMSQQSRQAPASSPSSNNPESTHEPKGSVGRPRNDHGVPTETGTDPLWWQSRPLGMIQTQLSNRGWRTPHFKHFTQKGIPAKRLTKEHYLNPLFSY